MKRKHVNTRRARARFRPRRSRRHRRADLPDRFRSRSACAPAAALIEHRHVEVGEQLNRQRARNRRRRRHQHIRVRPSAFSFARSNTPKRCCSSTMPSPSFATRTFCWMSAWVPNAIGKPAARQIAHRRSARRAHAASRDQFTPNPEAAAVSSESFDNAARRAARRRYHDGLGARFDRAEHRPERDRGFAAADIADEDTIHLARRGEVAADFSSRVRRCAPVI